jgi:prepilin-type N-terminal cleavage/methylation domain-containing protein
MKRLPQNGLSLVEVLCALALVGLMMVVVSRVSQNLNMAEAQSDAISDKREMIKFGISRIRSDIQRAAEVLDPTADPSRLDLIMWRTQALLPGEGTRLVLPPVTRAAIWPVRDPAYVSRTAYFWELDTLKHQVESDSPTTLFPAKEFGVESTEGLYEITLKLEVDGRASTFVSKVARF